MTGVPPDVQRAINRARAAREKRIRDCRTSRRTFIETAIKDDHGRVLQLAPVHLAWLTHIDYCWARGLKALIMAPFGHGKSSSLAVPIIAHEIGRRPGVRIKIVTNDDGSAVKRSGAAKNIIESPVYQAIFPGVRKTKKWGDHEAFVEREGHAIDPTIHARGIFTTGVGGRADVIVFDDIVDQANSQNGDQRKKVIAFTEQTWLSRLEPDGQVLAIGTAWHIGDAWHHFHHQPGWCSLIQRVPAACTQIDQEVLGAGDDYPGLLPIQAAPAPVSDAAMAVARLMAPPR